MDRAGRAVAARLKGITVSDFPILHPDDLGEVLERDGLVLLDRWQVGCPPCRALEPRLHTFARTHRGQFDGYRIDIETDQDTPARFNVMSIPTLVWLRDGRESPGRTG